MSLKDELIGQATMGGIIANDESIAPVTTNVDSRQGEEQLIDWEAEATEQRSDGPATPYGIPGRPEPEHPGTPPVSAFA